MAFKAWLDEIPSDKNKPSGGRAEISRGELQQVLEKAAWTTLLKAKDEIIASGCWQHSPAVEAAEDAINKAYRNLLSGKGTLPECWEACERWKAAGMPKPDLSRPALLESRDCFYESS
jgi:hypothetical protein